MELERRRAPARPGSYVCRSGDTDDSRLFLS